MIWVGGIIGTPVAAMSESVPTTVSTTVTIGSTTAPTRRNSSPRNTTMMPMESAVKRAMSLRMFSVSVVTKTGVPATWISRSSERCRSITLKIAAAMR